MKVVVMILPMLPLFLRLKANAMLCLWTDNAPCNLQSIHIKNSSKVGIAPYLLCVEASATKAACDDGP